MSAQSGAQADTLSTVKERGKINCGVSQGVAGFSSPDDQGKWTGFDIDFCRAVSAAVFGDPDKVSFIPLSTKERFTALQSGTVDLLSRQTTGRFRVMRAWASISSAPPIMTVKVS